jgi:hypothetical protein
MNYQRKVVFDDIDYFINPFYHKLKSFLEEEGLVLKKNLSISEGGKTYSGHKGYGHYRGKVNTIWLTYYDNGFELFGEIKIDLETKQILIEFPKIQVFLKNNF